MRGRAKDVDVRNPTTFTLSASLRNLQLIASVWVLAGCASGTTSQPKPEPESTTRAAAPAASPDVQPVASAVTSLCGKREVPSCATVTPAASDIGSIRDFITNQAVALRCPGSSPQTRALDVSAILQRSKGAQVVLMGEYHGAEQIRDFSAVLFAESVSEALETYLETGTGPIFSTYGFDFWTRNSFWALVEKARELRKEKRTVHAFGLDVPANLGWVHDKLSEIANAASSEIAKTILRASLPERQSYNARNTSIAPAYALETRSYYQGMLSKQTELCAAAPMECERALQLASALDLGAINQSKSAKTGDYYARREALMAFNARPLLGSGMRAYVHVGLYHSAKFGGATLGASLAKMVTNGPVYALVAAFGSGSTIYYNGPATPVATSPEGLSPVLEAMSSDAYFLPTSEPSSTCGENPFASKDFTLPNSSLKTKYGTGFDGFVWFRRLTPSL
jgi:hypothetical protein